MNAQSLTTVNSAPNRVGVLVCGSGTVAHTTALAFAGRGITTVISHYPVPSQPNEGYDERIFAITPPNVRFLKKLGFWQKLDHQRMSDIAEMRIHPHTPLPLMSKVEDRTEDCLQLSALSAGVENLAILVEHRELLRVGDEMVAEMAQVEGSTLYRVQAQNIKQITQHSDYVSVLFENDEVVEAKTLIAADGAESSIRQLLSVPTRVDHYGDACIVGNFKIERPHRNIAEQWFYPEGVIATLPIPEDQISLAWSCRAEKAERLSKDIPNLVREMEAATQGKWGKFDSTSSVKTFPLRRLQSSKSVVGRVILAGDSAHLIHPMLGLGLNLGLGDVSAILNHFGSIPALERLGQHNGVMARRAYEASRAVDVRSVQALTHSLHHVYLRHHEALPKIAGLGLGFLQKVPLVKELLIRSVTH